MTSATHKASDSNGKPERILLLRVDDLCDLYNTDAAVSKLKLEFPGAKLITLCLYSGLCYPLLSTDVRFNEVLSSPCSIPAIGDVNGNMLLQFVRNGNFDQIVVCSSLKMGEYAQLLTLAMRSCRNVSWLSAEGDLVPLSSPIGTRIARKTRLRQIERDIRGYWKVKSRQLFLGIVKLFGNRNARKLDAGRITRVLWIPADGLGDLIVSFKALDAFKNAYPFAEVDVLTRESHRSLIARLPLIHEVIAFEPPGRPLRDRRTATMGEYLRLAGDLRRRNYDAVIDLSGQDIVRMLCFLARIPLRVGNVQQDAEPDRIDWAPLMTYVPAFPLVPTLVTTMHRAVLNFFGVTWAGDRFELPISSDVAERVDRLLIEREVGHRYAVFCTRSAVAGKQWTTEGWRKVADYLAEQYGMTVILTGVPSAREYNGDMAAGTRNPASIIDLTGVIDLEELAEILRRADIMVTLDTAPMHLAAAMGTPLVSLFAAGSVPYYPPADQPHSILVADPTAARDRTHGERLESQIQLIPICDVLRKIDDTLPQPVTVASVADLQTI